MSNNPASVNKNQHGGGGGGAGGAGFPWKIHKIFNNVTKPVERPRESLPEPPEGMGWLQNEQTREWKLVPEEDAAPNPEVTVDFHANHQEQQHQSPFVNPFQVPPPPPHASPVPISSLKTATEDVNNMSPAAANPTAATAFSDNNSHDHDVPTPLASNHNHHNSFSPKDSNSNNNNDRVVVTIPSNEGMLFSNHSSGARSNSDPGESKSEEADWELLSDRASGSTHSHGIAFVSRNGSICSNQSFKQHLHKRTPSSSTIDSCDLLHLGPSGKGVLGVDYVEHVVLDTDTLQGICLAYKISASRLKRANHFSGESLHAAPKKLVIPISKQALRQGYLRVQDTDSKEYKLHALQAEFPNQLGLTEAKAYLELADWVLRDAIQSAREDYEWEQPDNSTALKAGEIRVMMNVQKDHKAGRHLLNFAAQGAGYYSPTRRSSSRKQKDEVEEEKQQDTAAKPVKMVHPSTVKLEEIHSVSPTHNSFGVEMQSLSASAASSTATATTSNNHH